MVARSVMFYWPLILISPTFVVQCKVSAAGQTVMQRDAAWMRIFISAHLAFQLIDSTAEAEVVHTAR
jgi:hypothetical protein